MWFDDRHAILLANMAVVMGLEGMCLEDGILDTWPRKACGFDHCTMEGKKPSTLNVCSQETC